MCYHIFVMLNKNDTSDIINYLVYTAESAVVSVMILIAVLYLIGPGAIKITRAVLIDPMVRQWNAPAIRSSQFVPTNMGVFFDDPSKKKK